MRINCMQIFHYLAHVLKRKSLFECSSSTVRSYACETGRGAIYNDFDFDGSKLLQTSSSTLAEQQHLIASAGNDSGNVVPQSAIDHAVLEADHYEGTLYDYLAFESELFDCTSQKASKSYMAKVYEILTTEELRNVDSQIKEKTLEIFEMRIRTDWKGADSIFDAWLLSNGNKRSWFPYEKFLKLFPDWESFKENFVSPTVSVSPVESEGSEDDFDISTVSENLRPITVEDYFNKNYDVDSSSTDEEFVKPTASKKRKRIKSSSSEDEQKQLSPKRNVPQGLSSVIKMERFPANKELSQEVIVISSSDSE